MKYFMFEVKRVSIEKVCWKAKMKDWYYMSEIYEIDRNISMDI